MKISLQFFGGSGARLGVSDSGKPYGTEYHTVYEQGNIKFLEINDNRSPVAPLETMTSGRVYVTLGAKGQLAYITYYDKANRRSKTIDLDHYHKVAGKKLMPHTALGYYHLGTVRDLTKKERNMVERVLKTWKNRP